MTTPRRYPMVLAAAAVAVLASLGGCGGNARSGAGHSAADQARPIWADYVQCARSNGFPDWPDPVVDDQSGTATFPDVAGLNYKAATAQIQNACGPILLRLPAQAIPKNLRPLTEQQLADARRYAECMRENGVPDWPDPNADGSFPLPDRLRDKSVTTPADQVCKPLLSGGRSPHPSRTAKPR